MEPTVTNITGSNHQKVLLYMVIGAVAVVLAAVIMYLMASSSKKSAEKAAQAQLNTVSAALNEASVQTPTAPPSANPIKNLTPTANPVETTNPFNHTYENPFK